MTRRGSLIGRMITAWAAVAVLALAGCGGGSSAGDTGGGGGTGDEAAATQGGAGTAAKLEFTAETLDGAKFDGRSLAGKPAVLWFWAPWCPTCGAQAPHVTSVAKKHKGAVTVVGVAGLDDRAKMRLFVDRTGVTGFTNLADEKGTVWKRFKVTAQSTYVLLDASGKVVHSGYLEDDELSRRVDELAR